VPRNYGLLYPLFFHLAITFYILLLTNHSPSVGRLNSLQSNAVVLQKLRKQREKLQSQNLVETVDFLKQLNIKLDDIDMLNPIHVSGTKGKGSTCAFVESILRELGFKTGFYSSPHLVHVRERIKINGVSLSEELFTKYFFSVYDRLQDYLMPAYFKFLTLMAFYVFIKEKVDVAIIEVGIGGEHDCTNVIKNPVVCGITTLDFDHTNLLGSTLGEIAWQKAGIFKNGSVAVVADQTEETMEVFSSRSVEKQVFIKSSSTGISLIGISGEHQCCNVSLALQLARIWLEKTGNNGLFLVFSTLDGYCVPESFCKGLSHCVWPGRSQVLKRGSVTYYIDGAHTPKSLKCCVEWYLSERKLLRKDEVHRVLIFHCTADRTPECLLPFLKVLYAYFLHCSVDKHSDQANFNATIAQELEKVKHNSEVWQDITKGVKFSCIEADHSNIEVLITGSLHLVGGFLSIIG
uniref:tetrahydrofolate synthase n=1 Tax=Syphacia muris TaxID=451379 RepID=A0A0N5A9R1_9BILA